MSIDYSHLSRQNLPYIEQLFSQWQSDPGSVDNEWRPFFEGVSFAINIEGSGSVSHKELNVYNLIQSYRNYGHYEADLNPLKERESHSLLALEKFDLSDADLASEFEIGSIVGLRKASLEQILDYLRACYCGTLTAQMGFASPEIRQWFIAEMEQPQKKIPFDSEQKQAIYLDVAKTEALERFFHTRYVGMKRFSIEGADALIPMLQAAVHYGTKGGVKDLVIGMAHRGRINVLANFMGKALNLIFAEFDGHHYGDMEDVDGDVKYHMGFSADKTTEFGECHISLAFNPSHLEAVCPVVTGMARAKQRVNQDTEERKTVVPILIHGDAAFSGQGVVMETLQMSGLKGYTVGGSIHIIVDNQIGFTADPSCSRSTPYSSDVAKMLLTPIIHVNGDDAEACVHAMEMAMRYRQEFKRDIVINLMCYRRHGHNESDEPAFTQPVMYQNIKKHDTLRSIYGRQLVAQNVMTADEVEKVYQSEIDHLQAILDETRDNPPKVEPVSFKGLWSGLRYGRVDDVEKVIETGVPESMIREVGEILTVPPENFNVHPKLKRLLESRRKMVMGEEGMDWGMAELMAYGSLIKEGTPVRLSGQDSVRGTFTHRHSLFYDAKNGEAWKPLSAIHPETEFCVYDSPLSEMAVLGFEFGNSSSDPKYLTIWEAQFGDFSNGAQIIIDQFLASAESKWYRMSGLTLLLPHGYEGQGPEHSSARLERYLQLCAQGNLQVCNLTTPAQIFHVLRRQMRRDFRKPLVIMSPKSLLRHPKVRSSIADLSQGHFHELLPDPKVENPQQIERLIFCSGKIYYDLDAWRDEHPEQIGKVAVARLEQIYPTPHKQIMKMVKSFPNLKDVVWLQEEPRNMGSWSFMAERLLGWFRDEGVSAPLRYIGRTPRASPATGSPHVHQKEQNSLIEECFKF